MIRVGLTLWFAVLTLAGPEICCCSLGRFVASRVSASEPKYSPVRKSCCGHAAKTETPKSPVKKQSPAPCPCKEKGDQCAAIPTADPASDESRSQVSADYKITLIPVNAGLTISVVSPQEWAVARPIALPFLTAEDFLRAMHFLRC